MSASADRKFFADRVKIFKKYLDLYLKQFFFFEAPYETHRSINKFKKYFDQTFTAQLEHIKSFNELGKLYQDFVYWDILYQRLRYGISFAIETDTQSTSTASLLSSTNAECGRFVSKWGINLAIIFPATSTPISDTKIATELKELYSKNGRDTQSINEVALEVIQEVGEDRLFRAVEKFPRRQVIRHNNNQCCLLVVINDEWLMFIKK
jgi:hypothetical protein